MKFSEERGNSGRRREGAWTKVGERGGWEGGVELSASGWGARRAESDSSPGFLGKTNKASALHQQNQRPLPWHPIVIPEDQENGAPREGRRE